MSGDIQQGDAIAMAEAALDSGDPDRTMEVLAPFFQTGLLPRGLWLVARVLTGTGQTEQAFELFRQAFNGDATLPYIEVCTGDLVRRFYDVPGSQSLVPFAEEFNNDIYGLSGLELRPGDVFIDVGANVGFVSIAVASRYPKARVIAFEPAPKTFEVFQRNLADNGIENVTAVNRAINADGRDLELLVMHGDSGASNAFTSAAVVDRCQAENIGEIVRVEALTLDAVFDAYDIERCAFLKLDCEGAEYEILRMTDTLDRIDQIAMELHINVADLEGSSPEALTEAFLVEVRSRVAQPPYINVASIAGFRNA